MPMVRKSRTFGDKVREARRKAGLSQTQVAQQMGVNPNFISTYERNTVRPSLPTAFALARALGVPLDALEPDVWQ